FRQARCQLVDAFNTELVLFDRAHRDTHALRQAKALKRPDDNALFKQSLRKSASNGDVWKNNHDEIGFRRNRLETPLAEFVPQKAQPERVRFERSMHKRSRSEER